MIYKDIQNGLLKTEVIAEKKFLDWYIESKDKTITKLKEVLSKSIIEELSNNYCQIKATVISSVISKSIIPCHHGAYLFKHININEEFSKAKKSNIVDYVSKVDYKDLLDNLNGTFERSTKLAGKQVFREFGITFDFNEINYDAINFAEQFNMRLSDNISKEIQNQIKAELIEGIREREGIPELAGRIEDVYSRGLTVQVPETIIGPYRDSEGNIIRDGYTREAYEYKIPPDTYAELVARTETARWFSEGTLNNYEASGVVETVDWLDAGDDRVCDLCLTMAKQTYTLEEARGLQPAHPLCRCAWVSSITLTKEEKTVLDKGIDFLINQQKELVSNKTLIKEESAWALRNITEAIRVKNIEPSVLGIINNRLKYNLRLENNYYPKKLTMIKTVNSTENIMEMKTDKEALEIGLFRTEKAIAKEWKNNKAFYKRYKRPWGAEYWVGEEKALEFVVDHEAGHLLMDEIFQKNVVMMEKFTDLFENVTKKQMRKISETATMDMNEFFAECYGLYINGKKTRVPESVIKFLDELELSL